MEERCGGNGLKTGRAPCLIHWFPMSELYYACTKWAPTSYKHGSKSTYRGEETSYSFIRPFVIYKIYKGPMSLHL